RLPWLGVWLSPDGRFLAHRCLPNCRLKLWRLDGPRPTLVLEDATGVRDSMVAFRADSRQLAIAQPDASVRLYDTDTGQLLRQWPAGGVVRSMAFPPRLQRLAVGGQALLRILDLDTGEILTTLPTRTCVAWIAWHPQGSVLAASGDDKKIYLWDTVTGNEA